MSRYTGPICRLCRRLGQSICYTDKCALHRKPSAPGMHTKSQKQLSEYGRQLREKQKARWTFGLTERTMRSYAEKSRKQAGASTDNLLIELERRLDTVVFRAGFASTQRQARQMTSHGSFLINGRRVDVPSYRVAPGDVITVRDKLKQSVLFATPKQEATPPRWLVLDRKNLEIKIQDMPTSEDINSAGIDSLLVTEYYSR